MCFGKFTLKKVDWKLEILEKYKEFARLNKGFVEAKLGSDIKLPESLKTLTEKDIEKIHGTITKDVVIKGDFSKLQTQVCYLCIGHI